MNEDSRTCIPVLTGIGVKKPWRPNAQSGTLTIPLVYLSTPENFVTKHLAILLFTSGRKYSDRKCYLCLICFLSALSVSCGFVKLLGSFLERSSLQQAFFFFNTK